MKPNLSTREKFVGKRSFLGRNGLHNIQCALPHWLEAMQMSLTHEAAKKRPRRCYVRALEARIAAILEQKAILEEVAVTKFHPDIPKSKVARYMGAASTIMWLLESPEPDGKRAEAISHELANHRLSQLAGGSLVRIYSAASYLYLGLVQTSGKVVAA